MKERGLFVGGSDLGPAELDTETGVIEAGPHVAARALAMSIHITEHGRVWPAEEITALGEVFTTDAPLHDLQAALEARGYRITYLTGLDREISAEVEHDVPAVTGESVTDEQIREFRVALLREIDRLTMLTSKCSDLLHYPRNQPGQPAAWLRGDQIRAQVVAAINARRGVP